MGIFVQRPQNSIGNGVDSFAIDTSAHTATLTLNSATVQTWP